MFKKIELIVVFLLPLLLSACTMTTKGKGSWEFYCGVRAAQEGEKPSSVSISSPPLDKLVDKISGTGTEIDEQEDGE